MNSVWTRTVAVSALAICCVAPRDATACECVESGPPCQAVWRADAVFAGTVRAIEPTTEGYDPVTQETFSTVRFDVHEAFVNSRPGSIELLSSPLSTCSFDFRVGEKYVVYARKLKSGRLTASICSRTRLLAGAREDLEYLRNLPGPSLGARVYGRVNEWGREPADEEGVDYGPVPDVVVHIRGAGFLQDVVTDRHGTYELTGVPIGKVTVSIATPTGFCGYSGGTYEITDLRACVEANFTLSAEAQASGVLLDVDGRPAAGVTIDAVAAELAGYRPPAFHEPVKTNQRGEFKFERLPPGEYVFGVNLATARWTPTPPPGPQIFYPGTIAVERASIVKLEPGEDRDLGVFKLPPKR